MVVKVVPPVRRERLEIEARATARVGPHRNLLAPVMVGTGSDGSAWMITDLAVGGTLAEHTSADVTERLRWAGELAAAVEHLHAGGVVHGDITPHNVLLDGDGHVMLADLGAAVLIGEVTTKVPGGYTPRFAAPERRRGLPATPESDMFGFGATILEMMDGEARAVPLRVRRVLRRCTDPRPRRRPTAKTAAQRLAPHN